MEKLDALLQKISGTLREVAGVRAVVLGGSRARGNASPDSDVDIGIYYDADKLDLSALDSVAAKLDDEHRENLVAPPGAWGDWVNGGAWLVVDGLHVDFILRDFARVRRVIDDCIVGHVKAHYQTGHPHAYVDAMYMGELAISRILWEDTSGEVGRLKTIAENYPPALKEAIIGFFSFEAGFSLTLAEANVDRDDIYYVSAHIVRSVSCLNQVLFAVNGHYCLNEKKAVSLIDDFPIKPINYKKRIEEIFYDVASEPRKACALLRGLLEEASCLCG